MADNNPNPNPAVRPASGQAPNQAPAVDAAEAERKRMEAAKQQVAAGNEQRDRIVQQSEQSFNSRPTPTQEENDLAKAGAHIREHEPDGSPEQTTRPLMQTPGQPYPQQPRQGEAEQQRQAEARRNPQGAGTYQTRASTPQTNEPNKS